MLAQLINYDFIVKDHLKFLSQYRYNGVDHSLLYNYIFSPVANFCLRFVPLEFAYFFTQCHI